MNQVIYADCMNPENGLPTLEDKSIDLCLTDPPWGSSFVNKKKKTVQYNDKWNPVWNLLWFHELERICNGIILVISTSKKFWWIRNTKPIGEIYIYFNNRCAQSKTAILSKIFSYLVYGKLRNKVIVDLKETSIPIGFVGKNINKKWIHPSPKGTVGKDIWLEFIQEIKPLNFIDPFLGSGTTAEVCTKLGIPWLGYEINEVYSQDINKRLKNCKREPKQTSIMDCVNR